MRARGLRQSLTDASINTGDAAGDSYTSIENLIGATSYGNTLTGNGGNNKLTGGNLVDIGFTVVLAMTF